MRFISTYIRKTISNPLTKGSAVVFIGTMLINISGYLYHVAVGRILGPRQYGELAALLSLLYILNAPSEVFRTILVKYFSSLKARKELGEAKYLFTYSTKIMAGISIVGFLLMLPFASMLTNYLHLTNTAYLLLMYGIFASYFLTIVNISVLQGFQRFTSAMIYANIAGWLRVILGVATAFFGVSWALVGNVMSNILGYISYLLPIRKLLTSESKRYALTKRSALSYSFPVLLATLGITLLYSQDVVLVKHFFDSTQAGIYSSLSVLGKVIFFASSAVGIVVFPIVAERKALQRSSTSIVYLATIAVACISLFITFLYFIFPSLIVRLLFGSAYDAAAPFAGIFAVFLSIFSVSSLLSSICLAENKVFVWILTLGAAVIQYVGISMFHHDLHQVIVVNISIVSILCIMLLFYYSYARRFS